MMQVTAAILLAAATAPPKVLTAEQLYCQVGRPVQVMVDVPRGTYVELALLDAAGEPLADAQPAARGVVNIARQFPDIWSLRRAAYVQCLHEGDPRGAALVLQPLLSRQVPITTQAQRPDGSPYTRITGWEAEPTEAGQELVLSGLRVYPEQDVVLDTSLGSIRLAMRPDEAPNTVWNFLRLVEGGFYDGVVFHRVVPLTRRGDPFVIQAGDPTGAGDGGPGYWLPIEPSTLPHDFGVISMARADHPDSAGSQFFICLSREGTARLDGQYCSFGEAMTGEDAIRAIAGVELADVATGRPADPPAIRRARLVAAPPRLPGHGRPNRPLSAPAEAPATSRPDRVPR